jgi:hypothetical protein
MSNQPHHNRSKSALDPAQITGKRQFPGMSATPEWTEMSSGASAAHTPQITTPEPDEEPMPIPQQKGKGKMSQTQTLDNGTKDILAKMVEALSSISQQAQGMQQPRTYMAEPAPFPENGTLKFNGDNVTVFLEDYVRRADYYGWSTATRIKRIIEYCEKDVKDIIEYAMEEWQTAQDNEEWAILWVAMRERFRATDRAQLEESEEAFKHWLGECRETKNLSLRGYLDLFNIKYSKGVKAGTLQLPQKGFLLVKGLGKEAAGRILRHFNLSPNRPLEFDFSKIQQYLATDARVQAEEPLLNPFGMAALLPGTLIPTGVTLQNKAQEQATEKISRPQGSIGVRRPPGSVPTDTEIDALARRLGDMQLQRTTIQDWDPRERELLSNPQIKWEVETRLAGWQQQGGPRAVQNAVPSAPRAQHQAQRMPPSRPMQANTITTQLPQGTDQVDVGPNQRCFGCGDADHYLTECPDRLAMEDNGWVHYNMEIRRLCWGPADSPQGEVLRVGRKGYQNATLKRLIQAKYKLDCISDPSPWLTTSPRVPPLTGMTNSFSGVIDPYESAGLVSDEEFAREWAESNAIINGAYQEQPENSYLVASTSIQRPTFEAKGVDHKLRTGAGIKKKSVDFPQIRNRQDRSDDYVPAKVVTFTSEEEPVPMEDVVQVAPETDSKTVTRKTTPTAKKYKLAEKLVPTPEVILQQLMDTGISIKLQDALANMPEVKKLLFKNQYTDEEFAQLQLGLMQLTEEEEEYEPQTNSARGTLIPDYISTEWANGTLTRCGPWEPGTTRAPPVVGRGLPIIARAQLEEEGMTTTERRAIDRNAGVEHVRRDCPRVFIEIQATKIQALLDSGAELNTIRLATAEAAGLPISSMPASMAGARLMTANGEYEGFQGIIFRVPVRVGQVEVLTNFFVVKSLSSPMILGNPFLADSKATFSYNNDGRTYCTLWADSGDVSTRFVATKPDMMNSQGTYRDEAEKVNGA